MAYGFSENDMDYIINTISGFPEIEEALIFGSRAMGNYKKGSDVDVALVGDQIGFSIISKVKDRLQEESPMPYMFDVVDYTHLNNEALKKHIIKHGKSIFKKS